MVQGICVGLYPPFCGSISIKYANTGIHGKTKKGPPECEP